jgi:hypothetical protein
MHSFRQISLCTFNTSDMVHFVKTVAPSSEERKHIHLKPSPSVHEHIKELARASVRTPAQQVWFMLYEHPLMKGVRPMTSTKEGANEA